MHGAVTKYKNLPAVIEDKGWQEASQKARNEALNKSALVKFLLVQDGTLQIAYEILVKKYNSNTCIPSLTEAVNALGKMPSRATIYNWCKAYKLDGLNGLLPQFKGKAKPEYSWAHRCIELYHAPNSPSFAQVSDQLVNEGFKVEHHNVRRFINELPHELGQNSPYRIGAKLYREKHKDFLIRSTDNIKPGFIYNGDGHSVDVHLAHPVTGKSYRPELVIFQDVASRYIVGWELTYSENSISTLTALSRAMKNHLNIPAMVYIDNGSGFKSKMMNDETSGFYAQFEIEPIFAIPGNARAKWIERFFRHMEERVGRRFESYCGKGFDERKLQLVLKEAQQGKTRLPSLDEWIAEFKVFLDYYHNSPHPERAGQTRQQVWDEIERVPPCEGDFVILPRAKVNVRRGQIKLHKRTYTANFLHQFNGKELLAGFDLQNDEYIQLYQLTGEFIMICQLKLKSHALPTSRIDERDIKRSLDAIKRKEKHIAEDRARAALSNVIDSIELDTVKNLSADVSDVAGAITEQAPHTFDIDLNALTPEFEEVATTEPAELSTLLQVVDTQDTNPAQKTENDVLKDLLKESEEDEANIEDAEYELF
jgi:putative transposase